MTWHTIAGLGRVGCARKTDLVVDGTYPPDVLLQILLPVVLILAFLDAGAVHRVASAASKGTDWKAKYQDSLLELQRQRVTAALEKVENARKQELGVFYLAETELQLSPGGGLLGRDAPLAKSCDEVAGVFGSEDARNAEALQLYQRVLAAAELSNPPGEMAVTMRPGDSGVDVVGPGSVITAENRDFVGRSIGEFMQSLEDDVLRAQTRLIDSVFHQYNEMGLDDRYQLLPETRGLEQQIAALNREGQDTTALADALATAFYRRIKQDFDAQGYHLLEKAWGNR